MNYTNSMLDQKKQHQSLECVRKHSKDGERKGKSNLLNQARENTFMTSKISSPKKPDKQKTTTCMQEYQQEDKSKTLKLKSSTSKNNTQHTRQSKISEADLISKEKALKPFWNNQVRELSEKLWLPTKTGSVASDTNSYNGLLRAEAGRSWFSITKTIPLKKNSSRTSSRSSQYFQPISMVSEVINTKSRKIRLLLTPEQKQVVKQWFGVYRWYYNRTIDHIESVRKKLKKIKESRDNFKMLFDNLKDKLNLMLKIIIGKNNINPCVFTGDEIKKMKPKKISHYSEQTIRNEMRKIYKYEIEGNLPSWCLIKVPSRIIDGAIYTCVKNYLNNIEKINLGTIKTFKLKYKTKKDINDSISITKDNFSKKKNGFCVRYNKGVFSNIKSVISFKGKIKKDTRLQCNTKLNTFDLVIPYDKKSDKQTPLSEVISLDPGSRTFLTGYSPMFHTVEIGKDTTTISLKIRGEMNILKSKIDKSTNKKKKGSLRKALERKSLELQNLRDELHWKTIRFLTTHYKTIMLGDLSSKSISSRKGNLSRQTKDNFSFLSHYKFKKRLEEKCLDNGNEFYYVDESYTTKTCTSCGDMNRSIGSKKIFNCNKCNMETGRDYNGARNIYLKGWFSLPEWEIHPPA
jgi:IS605 OrfB family transposase